MMDTAPGRNPATSARAKRTSAFGPVAMMSSSGVLAQHTAVFVTGLCGHDYWFVTAHETRARIADGLDQITLAARLADRDS